MSMSRPCSAAVKLMLDGRLKVLGPAFTQGRLSMMTLGTGMVERESGTDPLYDLIIERRELSLQLKEER
jgi:hypothetical protein